MDFMERMKEALAAGMEGSKDFFEKARDKMHEFGESSVLRLEIRQLEAQAKQELATLGTIVYQLLIDEEKGSVSSKTPELKDVFTKLEGIKQQIADKEKQAKAEASDNK